MGLLSSLFGKKPKAPTRQGYTEADQQMLGEASRLGAAAQQYVPLQNTRLAQAADTTSPRLAAERIGSVTAAQRAGRMPTQGVFDARDVRGADPALARARGISRITSMGDEQAKMASLRDRVSMLKYGRGIRSGGFAAIAGSAGVQDANQRVASAASMAPDYMGQYRSNFLGTLAGTGLGMWQNGAFAKQPDLGGIADRTHSFIGSRFGSVAPVGYELPPSVIPFSPGR